MKPIIEIQNISKRYEIHRVGRSSLRELGNQAWLALKTGSVAPIAAALNLTKAQNTHWALKDISFDVMPGEVVGLVGKNGCGKSTLLKILSKITRPTMGRAILRGRSSALLEVGTGFHPELSGRENIFLNGAILGMRTKEISKALDEIVAFAENETFLDMPVKRYSSGMYVRLAFSVAAHLAQPILFIDEVLAVGDSAFQAKCLKKAKSLSENGRTILFVSHDQRAVAQLCTRCIYLDRGEIRFQGRPEEVLRSYNQALSTDTPKVA